MRIDSRFRVGGADYTVTADHEDVARAFHEAIQATPRQVCDVCGSIGLEDKRLVSYTTKEQGFIYVKVICSCDAESTMGKYKDGGIFWKPYEVSEYRQGSERQPAADTEQQAEPEPAPQPQPPQEQPASQPRRAQDASPIGPDELAQLNELASALGWGEYELRQFVSETYSVERLTDLTLGQARGAYKRLKEQLDDQVPF